MSHLRQTPLKMKSLIIVLCVALTVNAEVSANPTAEHLRTLATLLQEHHHRFTRQVATSPTSISTGGTEAPTSTFSQSSCQLATERFTQSCFVAHGRRPEVLAQVMRSSDPSALYRLLSEAYCSDGRCQSDLHKFYEICIGIKVSGR